MWKNRYDYYFILAVLCWFCLKNMDSVILLSFSFHYLNDFYCVQSDMSWVLIIFMAYAWLRQR